MWKTLWIMWKTRFLPPFFALFSIFFKFFEGKTCGKLMYDFHITQTSYPSLRSLRMTRWARSAWGVLRIPFAQNVTNAYRQIKLQRVILSGVPPSETKWLLAMSNCGTKSKFCEVEKPQSGASGAKPRTAAKRRDDGIYKRLPIAFP